MTAARPTRKPVALAEGLSDQCRRQLLRGHDWFYDAYGRNACDDPDRMARMEADWEEHRDELLAEWIPKAPGCRPYAWWEFDAPARRERVDGDPHPFDTEQRKELAKKWHAEYPDMRHDIKLFQLYFGTPACVVGEGMVEYETEEAYLRRLDLLLPGEADLLDDDDDDLPSDEDES